MTSPLEAVILDVGHGNCTVLRDGPNCAVIDAPKDESGYEGRALYGELARSKVTHIEHIVVSHSDADHMAGVCELISDQRFTFGTLWFNPDGMKNTREFQDLRRQARLAHDEKRIRVPLAINTGTSDALSFGRVGIDVLHPDIEWAGSGPANYRGASGRLTTNTMSIVLRVSLAGLPAVLLMADIDSLAVDRMISLGVDISAPVLVFPHHGGKCGGDEFEFAKLLMQQVQPRQVVFSISDGGRFSNPNPQIMAGVRTGAPDAHISCTRLSKHCHLADSDVSSDHLSDRSKAARINGRRCAGSISVRYADTGLIVDPDPSAHRAFITNTLAHPICLPQAVVPQPRSG